ncbi:hypothetical protein LTR53_018293 [Teratosphaeriaceae sp. CCFEE 6253]|nr:hypothetical protein LTR53_018293 [Teratosphaeriaceae sp. CCFEE 6253]
MASFFSTLRRMFSSDPEPPSRRDSDLMFHTATIQNTPTSRWIMAHYWLKVALRQAYAPSCLYAAEMLMQKTFYHDSQAPASALSLSAKRYTYASKADFAAGRRIPTIHTSDTGTETPADLPNPFYDPEEAKRFLCEVFYAYVATELRQRRLAETQMQIRQRKLQNVADADDYAGDADNMGEEVPERIKKYLRDADTREMWEGEAAELEKEARAICDREGWDLYDEEDGGLVYRARPVAGGR